MATYLAPKQAFPQQNHRLGIFERGKLRLDEVAFWRSESTANPDKEVWRAIRASMASFGSESVAIIGSSPYARKGLLYDGWKRYFGKPDAKNLVWQAGTKVMNPTIPDDFLAEEFDADPASAEAEYNANFRTDVETFIAREVVEAAVVPGRYELRRASGCNYVAFVDPSGGSSDAMTLAVAHREGDGVIVVDCIRERKPPFSPESVVEEFSILLKSYGIQTVSGDRYAGEWPRERFQVHGIRYETSDRVKSDIYRDTLPLLNSGKVQLPEHQRLITQLCSLERRTARGGKDSVDHPPGSHDDTANAVCGAILLASGAVSFASMITQEMIDQVIASGTGERARAMAARQQDNRLHGYRFQRVP